jgi:class 3 adenylate cyclase/tetratricopeptide (TPR) repeat protein
LVAVCPSCGEENPERARFCLGCGAPLAEATPAPALEERKVVSVLFCDLVGFTAASEAADPEDVRARIRPYHARVREVIERYSGTVEKFVGDAVMAVFGAPVAHEDDAERAVRAGLRILEAISELNEAEPGLELQVRVGINTGEAVVALGARPEEGEGIVTGDVVNTASRLQGAAPVNGVAVSEQTFRVTERVFDYEPLEPVVVKGKSAPLALYRPLAARARFGSEVTRSHATALVGRELEKPLLIGTFERAAQQRSCQLVTVVGEPGVGKSRLCMELFSYIEERPGLVRWRQGRCLPYGEGIAFWALGEIVKADCGILESDSPDAVRAKLERALPEDAQDRPWLLARLGPLVGLTGEPAAQEESFTAWRRFLEGLAGDGPAVLVFEDLHWADPALLSFLEHLADWAEGVPLLVLCTARPELHEQHSGWAGGLRNATTINLAPLSDKETAQLVSALLERAVLPAETQQALLERAGGNPLYAEEFVRLLTDRGGLEGEEVVVPESVQALIAARLDTLSPERKGLLQDASVVGKVFWAGALAAMGERELDGVEQALHELARRELVRPSRTSSMEAEAEYGFWHALVRDVCYGQIPRASRAERHQRAAAWIEEKAGSRAEDLADVLAHHYLAALELARAAGLPDDPQLQAQAVQYLRLAGERALGLDVERAQQNLAQALDLTGEDDPQQPLLLERWAQALLQQGRLREARDALDQALTSHRQDGDRLAAGRTLTQLAHVLSRLADPRQEETLAEALRLLEAEPPGPELVAAHTQQARARYLGGAGEEAVAAADKALSLAAQLDLPQPTYALGYRGAAHADRGERQGVEEMRQALSLAIEQGEGRSAAGLYNNLAIQAWVYEGPQAALELGREGIEFAQRRGLTEVAELMAAGQTPILAELGRTEEALSDAARLADQLEQAGDINFTEPRSLQLRLLTEQGRHEQAPSPEPMLKAARDSGQPQMMATTVAAAAGLLHAQGQPEQARLLLHELDQTPASRSDPVYATVLPSLVRSALALNDPTLASSLTKGVPPLTPLHQHALTSSQAQLAEAAGNPSEAASLYTDAAHRWHQFGNQPEHAHALLGQGRCLVTLSGPGGEKPLREARELFKSMGYKPALAETDALLAQTTAAAS